MHDGKLMFCLLKLVIALQPFQMVLPRTPPVEVIGAEVVTEVVCCVKYFILYELYSVVIINLISLSVIVRFVFNHLLIEVIKKFTPDNLILRLITATNANK